MGRIEKKLFRMHRDSEAYQISFKAAMQIHNGSQSFPMNDEYFDEKRWWTFYLPISPFPHHLKNNLTGVTL
jgi:hypothetical protein